MNMLEYAILKCTVYISMKNNMFLIHFWFNVNSMVQLGSSEQLFLTCTSLYDCHVPHVHLPV